MANVLGRAKLKIIVVNRCLKRIFYYSVKSLCYLFNFFYFRHIKIYGKENIPSDAGIIYSANHCCGFLDPLLIGTYTPKQVHSLTRSDMFNKHYRWFMSALKMIPVYRLTDGFGSLTKNHEVFDKCRKLLGNKESLIMFPEGGQNQNRHLRSISKGSSRLAYMAQKEHRATNIYLQPIGINYSHLSAPRCTLHFVFGEPISVNQYLEDDLSDAMNINRIRTALEKAMKKCLWQPEIQSGFESSWRPFDPKHNKLSFQDLARVFSITTTKKVETIPSKAQQNSLWIKVLSFPNLIPYILVKKILGLLKGNGFYHSMKYALGAILFPLYWFITVLFLILFIPLWSVSLYLALCIVCVFFRQKLLSA